MTFLFSKLGIYNEKKKDQHLPGLGCRYSVVLVIMSITALVVVSTFYSTVKMRT